MLDSKITILSLRHSGGLQKKTMRRHDNGADLPAVIGCTSLLFMAKVYNPAGFRGYLNNRYQAFSNSIGRGELMECELPEYAK